MANLPLQMVVVELENGRRGVFFGHPLVGDSETDADCQVEQVYFSNVNLVPDDMGLSQISGIALAEFAQQRGGGKQH